MSSPRIALRRSAAVGAVAALALGMLGCSPEPEPDPTPTAAFASEEEAFAAAEKVYREYIEAGNANESVEPFLTGDALEDQIQTQRYLKSQDLELSGVTRIASIDGQSIESASGEGRVNALVCIDVSQTMVLDADGKDVTPPDRAGRLLLRVQFVGRVDSMVISQSETAEETC